MAETLTVYETAHSLLLKTDEVAYKLNVRSHRPLEFIREEIKTHSRYTLKLVVHNGLLHVRYGWGKNKEADFTQPLMPDFAGLVAPYITLANLPYIHAFLNKHFPDRTHKPLTNEEKWTHDELRTKKADRKLKNKVKQDKYYREVSELIIRIAALSFPVYSEFVDNRLSDGFYNDRPALPAKYHKAFRAKTFKEILSLLFGTYRKDLAKAVVGSSLDRIVWASCFAGVLDIDAIIEGLQDKTSTYAEIPFDVSPLIGYPKNVIRELYLEGLTWREGMAYIEDALEMAAMIPMEERKRCTSWDSLHGIGMVNYSYAVDGSTEIQHPRDFEQFFADASIKEYRVSPLKTAQNFIDTGQIMDVCVGSKVYISRAFAGEGYCFRLDDKEDNPYALFEVKKNHMSGDWNICQARKHRNGAVEESLYQQVEAELGKYITLGVKNNA